MLIALSYCWSESVFDVAADEEALLTTVYSKAVRRIMPRLQSVARGGTGPAPIPLTVACSQKLRPNLSKRCQKCDMQPADAAPRNWATLPPCLQSDMAAANRFALQATPNFEGEESARSSETPSPRWLSPAFASDTKDSS